MNINLNELSLRQLRSLKKRIDASIEGYEERRLRAARIELEEKANALGFKLTDLIDLEIKNVRPPVAPIWRHKENHALVWSGRGRKPHWFSEAELIPKQD